MLLNKPLGRFETVGTSFMNDYINMTTSSIFQLSSGGLSRTYKPLDTLFLLSSGGLARTYKPLDTLVHSFLAHLKFS